MNDSNQYVIEAMSTSGMLAHLRAVEADAIRKAHNLIYPETLRALHDGISRGISLAVSTFEAQAQFGNRLDSLAELERAEERVA